MDVRVWTLKINSKYGEINIYCVNMIRAFSLIFHAPCTGTLRVLLPVARMDVLLTIIIITITIVASVSPISGRGEVLGAEQGAAISWTHTNCHEAAQQRGAIPHKCSF